mgnify:CR=1 FL=1
MEYIDFASKISFYEFLQNEFKKPHFNTDKYKDEINLLRNKLNIEYLTKILGSNPRIIDIFEELLQLKRFTNTQYVNFCFDVNVLNNSEQDLIIKYINTRVFKFENGRDNKDFLDIYNKFAKTSHKEEKEIIFNVKRAIIGYIDKCQKKREILYTHLQNSIDARLRVAKYLIENLNADEYLSSLNLENFLKFKRHPIDTKRLHGNFGIMKISKILEENGFININGKWNKGTLSVNNFISDKFFEDKFCYLRERAVQGVKKRKDNKLKVFDFILLYNGIPKVVIETNFYTTSGTKIGINQGEYVDLLEDIDKFNKKEGANLKFIWITDGNYWLTKEGENRFKNLKANYFRQKFTLLNYNLFRENLPEIKKEMQN